MKLNVSMWASMKNFSLNLMGKEKSNYLNSAISGETCAFAIQFLAQVR